MDIDATPEHAPTTIRVSMCQYVLYFRGRGAVGFGGPVALANYMRRDLVERRGWLTAREYENGLALAAACPGPLAYQLGVYCGYVRFGVSGGLAVAVRLRVPPFVICDVRALVFRRFVVYSQSRPPFYGNPPALVAPIIKACWRLAKRALPNVR